MKLKNRQTGEVDDFEPLVIVPDYEVNLDELYEDGSILNQQIRDDLEALIEE